MCCVLHIFAYYSTLREDEDDGDDCDNHANNDELQENELQLNTLLLQKSYYLIVVIYIWENGKQVEHLTFLV